MLKIIFVISLAVHCIFAVPTSLLVYESTDIPDVQDTWLAQEKELLKDDADDFMESLDEDFTIEPIDDATTVDSDESQLPEEDIFNRINWQPVWDDIEGNNEFRDIQNGSCRAPNGRGLENLLRRVYNLLPRRQMQDIARSYQRDPEVIALKRYQRSEQYKRSTQGIARSREYQTLRQYACQVLHIDLRVYGRILMQFIANKAEAQNARAPNSSRVGIRGMLRAIRAVIPHQKIRELYNELKRTDEELRKAVIHLKSREFHRLMLNIKQNVPEYRRLSQRLTAIGVPLKEIRDKIAAALGWPAAPN